MIIPREEFLKYLCPYRDEHVYLDRLEIDPDKVEVLGFFHRGRYPYSKRALGYLAASEAVLFLTQLIYAMAGAGLRLKLRQGKGETVDMFLTRVSEDKVHVTHIDMKFRRKVNKSKNIRVRLSFVGARKLAKSIHLIAKFDFDNRFFGRMSAVMLF